MKVCPHCRRKVYDSHDCTVAGRRIESSDTSINWLPLYMALAMSNDSSASNPSSGSDSYSSPSSDSGSSYSGGSDSGSSYSGGDSGGFSGGGGGADGGGGF